MSAMSPKIKHYLKIAENVLDIAMLLASLYLFVQAIRYASKEEYAKATYYMAFSVSMQLGSFRTKWEEKRRG